MLSDKILSQILEHIDAVIKREPPLGSALWQEFINLHPADIASFLSNLPNEQVKPLFLHLPSPAQLAVFQDLPDSLKVYCLSFLDNDDKERILNGTPLD